MSIQHSMFSPNLGIAASLLVEGQTVHSLFGIKSSNKGKGSELTITMPPLNKKKIVTVRNQFEDVIALLIEEASMMHPVMLSKISTRCQQIKKNKKPFGGLLVVLLGDFFQLKPVVGTR